jgi:general secretion pathway protein G
MLFMRIRRRRRGKRREEGFTLIELMVVLVILGLLATIVIINVLPAADRAKLTTAHASVTNLEEAIELFNLHNHRYPTNEEGLAVLVTSRQLRRLDKDPWGNDFAYRLPGRAGRPFDVYSMGADGREGGDGDNADIYP